MRSVSMSMTLKSCSRTRRWCPNSGPTVASRTCMVVGKLVESAAKSIRRTLAATGLPPEGYTRDEFLRACRVHIEQQGTLRASAQYHAPHDVKWDDEKYEGDAYGSYAWAAYVAEVSVDTVTFEVRVDDFVAVQEVGKVINPLLASGQIEGGVAQAIGWALYEDVAWREGRMANAQMTNYIMPTSVDLPPIRVYFEEVPYPHGPAGAKGIGELPMDGPAPAIANAIAHATGVDVRRLPISPEALASLDGGDEALDSQTIELRCRVNGEEVTLQGHPLSRLLDVLRTSLHLTGTKEGCGEGECGACGVMIDGRLVNSCLVPLLHAEGTSIVTIEGIGGEALHGVQQAFLDHGGAQCGICTPGMVLAAVNLLDRIPDPSFDDVRVALSGNLCRCTGYVRIFESVLAAVKQRRAAAAS